MVDFLNKLSSVAPEKIAYICGVESISYGELIDKARRMAFSLGGAASPVAVKGHKQPYMITAFIACLMAGRAYIPCDISMPESRIASAVAQAKAEAMIDSDTQIGKDEISSFLGGENDIAYIIFTSGSSGEPKGVPISRRNLRTFIKWVNSLDALKNCAGKTVLNQARFSFDLSVADIYFSLSTGSTLFALTADEQADPDRLIKAMMKADPAAAVITPTFAKYCLCIPEFTKENLPSLECIFFCGELLEPKTAKALFERFPGIRLINAYGPTEATCAVCATEITADMLGESFLPCGNVNEASCLVTSKDGEIFLEGDSVFNGYLGKPPVTPPYSTGDKGEIKNSVLYCYGRKYGYIKYKGHRIELDEIKQALSAIEGVEQCSVKTITSGSAILGISAQIVTKTLTADEIKLRLAETLPAYMIPKTVKIKDTVSFNANGKQDF